MKRWRPSYRRLRPKGAHNAGIFSQEITVKYPFHPLTGQSFVVLGRYDHYGAPHMLVRAKSGATHILPEWMSTEAAAATEVVSLPRLSVERLIELRDLLDRIVSAPPSGDHNLGGREDDKTIEIEAAGIVRCAGAAGAVDCTPTIQGAGIVGSPSDGSVRKKKRRRGSTDSGGRR